MMAVEQRHHVGIPGGLQEQSWMMGDQDTNQSETNYQDYNGYQDQNNSKEDMENEREVARNGGPISVDHVEHGQGDHEPQENPTQDNHDKEIRKKFDTPYPRQNSPRTSPRDRNGSKNSSENGENGELDGSEKLEWENDNEEKSDPIARAPSRQNTDDSEDDDSGLLMNMTEDQRQAMEELKNMKLDLAYTADEDPPEYDVAERVRQLNEELANEPSPDEDRERAIKFKENLVDLYAPPPEVDEEEEEEDPPLQKESQENTSESSEQKSDYDDDWQDEEEETDGPQSVTEEEETNKNKQQMKQSKTSTVMGNDTRNEDKVLVERNGKFELLSANDLTPEERDMYFGETTDSEPFSTARSESSSQSGSHQPTPPKNPRPATANGTTTRRRDGRRSAPPGRAQSALLQTYSDPLENFNYTSPYALSPRDKHELERQQKAKEKREKQTKQLEQMEEEEKQRERNEAFLAWLKKKREDNEQRKKMEKEKEKDSKDNDGSDKPDAETAFKEWVKRKKQQKKQEKNIEQYQKKEEEETAYVRPRSECNKAYKEWLKKKNGETRKQRNEDKERIRMKRLLAKRSRKAYMLASSVRQSQSFQYVDYYGYRF